MSDLLDDLDYVIGYIEALTQKRKYRRLQPWVDQITWKLEEIRADVDLLLRERNELLEWPEDTPNIL